jgi:hypothetical protein
MLPSVKTQVHEFVTDIANPYRDVPYHNFEHASHVIMSASKLMKRIINPDGIEEDSLCDGTSQKVIRAFCNSLCRASTRCRSYRFHQQGTNRHVSTSCSLLSRKMCRRTEFCECGVAHLDERDLSRFANVHLQYRGGAKAVS